MVSCVIKSLKKSSLRSSANELVALVSVVSGSGVVALIESTSCLRQ